ncbi:anti-sigma factor family protein [Streptomyces sp. NRRL S-646]|uniref:anti-sigma factor family protein n=1 Tax=Streptomyces sp. NRRL S-646 TaxID=1463917 RepID=UPI0004C7D3EE|nr:membrane protein [Streptomyces sp. NRRL S-646]
MTSTTDMAGHPDVAEISDLTEGLLPPSRTADVRRHLDECELCADVYTSLEEIRGLLGSVPGPTRMPAAVAGRIDAALAAEALLNATAPEVMDAPELVGASRSTDDAGDSARVSRETSATADRPAGHSRAATTGPGRKQRKKGGRRRVAILGTVFTVAALGFGSVLLTSLNDGKPPASEAQGRKSATEDTFSEAKLEDQVTGLLKSQSPDSGSHAPHSLGVEGGTNQPKVFKAPTVPDCVRNGIGRTDPALAAKPGTYKRTDVLLVVMSDASASTKVTAYIVDASCVSHASTVKAKVLLTHSYTRP